MGHKRVCLDCKKSFSQGSEFRNRYESYCPDCGKPLTMMPHRFRPPKKTEVKKWETIRFLVEHGFPYQHIYRDVKIWIDGSKTYETLVSYPENLRDAKVFVEEYKDQAIENKK